MNLIKETLELSDKATSLLCDIEKLDYTADALINNLERIETDAANKIIIDHTKTALNIMIDYISSLEKNIKKNVQQTDALFKYIKEQQSNEQKESKN